MRARSMKPGFFKNEDLAECSPFARLLFPGLWMLADREGRLEYRPKRIKAEIFPFDNVDVAALVSELETHRLVKTYTVDGAAYLWVIKFLDHQRPHQNETTSIIPSYSSLDEVLAPMDEGLATKVQSTSLLIPSSLIPSSRILNIPTTPKTESSGHKETGEKPVSKDDRPNQCKPEDWKNYLCYSRGFHRDKATQLGARAPYTEKKVLEGAKALDNLIRVKGYTENEVIAVLGWSTENEFWSDNLRSIKSLLKVSGNGDIKYINVLTAMKRDLERRAQREGA